jgi:LmbE family N-acetylglucosaminyl deacetylase
MEKTNRKMVTGHELQASSKVSAAGRKCSGLAARRRPPFSNFHFPISVFQFLIPVFLLALLLSAPLARGQGPSAEGNSLPEVMEALERARVVTRILCVTAHPDDEPGGVLAYLARGLHADVALLSLTRGEGGQNALGPEQGPPLGVIRTEELLRATRIYGTRLFFTRAADFGYTKSADEALRVWGEPVLRDMVQVIRTFRPHIVINHWHGTAGGHGQHQAAGILTPQAVVAAADAKRFPDAGPAWKVESLLAIARGSAASGTPGYAVPINEVSALWGKTWGEIGLEGFLNHRTQGIAMARTSPFFRREIRLTRVEGKPPDRALLAQPIASLAARYPGQRARLTPVLAAVNTAVASGRRAAQSNQWSLAARTLTGAAQQLAAMRKRLGVSKLPNLLLLYELDLAQARLHDAIVRIAGMKIEPVAEQSEIVASSSFTLQMNPSCRPEVKCAFAFTDRNASPRPADTSGIARYMMNPPEVWRPYGAPPADRWMKPEQRTVDPVEVTATVEGYSFAQRVSVVAIKSTSTTTDVVPPALVPDITINVAPKQFVLRAGSPPRQLEMLARVSHYSPLSQSVTVGLDVPAGWMAPALQSFDFTRATAVLVRFTVGVPENVAPGSYRLRPFTGDPRRFARSLVPLPTMPARMWQEPAEIRVHVMDVAVPEHLSVGYIAAENDPIPQALAGIGVRVELLDEIALAFGDLSKFDAICVGIRAYELRPDLIRANQRLLDYAAAGGTLVVQYQRDGVWNQLLPGPYPARMPQRDARVADETAPVRVLAPEHPVLNAPNRIRPEDFDGWVQERGLYFWGEWDARNTPLLAMKDPTDAEEMRGSLLVAAHGQGTYIFTGLAFFRQLPEGVPGAYRLFVNLLSQTKVSK